MSFAGYERFLHRSGKPVPANHFEDIRTLRVTSMFFLCRNDALREDAIAILDRINNCDAGILQPAEVPGRRLLTLSDYGFYLFL